MNTPYVKKLNEITGEILNPIVGKLESPFDNRRTRRKIKNKVRFFGNKEGVSLSVFGKYKYKRVIQVVKTKRIEHYILQ